ncbi:hypothetical protein BCR36DRAFT_373490 [Piromyces finnis]|uniref:Uncharacterized protein n=1 Tax=Piromyces finnis TaxID=1754191 RepID=A0A1Y1UZN7_9FUNG|nr:hypothetical protein BCR36DRAFT_373490 [Piromyces finnis]|eukprot:ORX44192.1 hypothetical protein BCR36DRAFT_373490 [Piromyces finnis]
MSNFNNFNYMNQMNNKFHFVPPPKLPSLNNIPSSSLGESSEKINSLTTTQNPIPFNNINVLTSNNVNNTFYPQFANNSENENKFGNPNFHVTNPTNPQNNMTFPFNSYNQTYPTNNVDNIKQDNNKNNKENKESIKNSQLSKYIEKDSQWFKTWFNSNDKTQCNTINSYKKMKYMDVFKSFLKVYNDIQKMKDIKKELEENGSEIQLNEFNDKINSCKLLKENITTQLKELNNSYAISNWKFKNNKIKKKRKLNKKRKIELKNSIKKEEEERKENTIEEVDKNLKIPENNTNIGNETNKNDEKGTDEKKQEFFNISNIIKKQKSEKDPDLLECQKLIDMVQKLQKIRNIRRSKEIKKQGLLYYEDNSDFIKIDERIEELSQIIKPTKDKKKKKKKNHSNNIDTNNISNVNLPIHQANDPFVNISKNNFSIFLKKKKIYRFTEKNKKLLNIKCEPYSNVYEYFNNTKLDMKSLIYIRKEWDKYIVKEGGTSIPPHFVKPVCLQETSSEFKNYNCIKS